MSGLVTGWGRTTATRADRVPVRSVDDVVAAVRAAGPDRPLLARGLGRAYGDAALCAGGTVLDVRPLAGPPVLDADGVADVAAGTSIGELLDAALPHGLFVPVSPGTRHVTVGGALAADVHGKNHHRDGSIARHLESVTVVDGTGTVRELAAGDPLLGGVLGGMGLGGVVVSARVRLLPVASASMLVRTRRTADLEETMAVLAADDAEHRYTVAWLDLLAGGRRTGRGVVTSGDHAGADTPGALAPERHDPPPRLPAVPALPLGAVRRGPATAFNTAYWHRAPRRPSRGLQSTAAFFHPLDVLPGWNGLYGPRGFVQYQVVVPDDESLRRLVAGLRADGVAVTLAVLKRFGPGSGHPLSFPSPGWTLAADLAADAALGPALDRADALVAAAGGRTYLAKDARVRPDVLQATYPGLERWRALRATLDPRGVFTSDLARRLHL
ncbi:FAD-binding oxidoreductase [Phycicoccus flavus]|uniref:FAD-binding oxidoreductase n=1 Tax=Phycicoccus flavus TaxID=2502783 RepID=A0A8T6QZ72_9MICO|nr:FAD-binding oxidoreductase [Phycicoccus flavus]NHA67238.1 FAD-binding oxidoreductase [Phycicoccus flavus]